MSVLTTLILKKWKDSWSFYRISENIISTRSEKSHPIGIFRNSKISRSNGREIIRKWYFAISVQRALKEMNFKTIKKKVKPMLSKKNIKARIDFAKKYMHWSVDDWG